MKELVSLMILSLSHTNTRAHTPQLIHQEIRRFYLQNLLESEFSSPPAVLPSSTATGSWLLWWSLNQPLDFCPSSPSGLLTKKAKVRAFFEKEVKLLALHWSPLTMPYCSFLACPAQLLLLTSTPTAFPRFDDLSYTLDQLLLFCFLFGRGVWLVKSFFKITF